MDLDTYNTDNWIRTYPIPVIWWLRIWIVFTNICQIQICIIVFLNRVLTLDNVLSASNSLGSMSMCELNTMTKKVDTYPKQVLKYKSNQFDQKVNGSFPLSPTSCIKGPCIFKYLSDVEQSRL